MKYTTQDYISALTGLLVLVILFIIGWKIGKYIDEESLKKVIQSLNKLKEEVGK